MSVAYELEHRPAVINFSGGRSSAYMTHHILEEHGGLPDDAAIVFCNTGKEHEQTLQFVKECSERWGVRIYWLEYQFRREAKGGRKDPKHVAVEVDFLTASREGEPFAELIDARRMLPNPVTRFCTSELKVRTALRFAQRVLGWKRPTNYLGMRADEPKRINRTLLELCHADYPLYHAGVTKPMVKAFWRAQPFDLDLTDDEGNCDLCFMKGGKKLIKLIEMEPVRADWWIEQEQKRLKIGSDVRDKRVTRFRQTYTYDNLHELATTQGVPQSLFSLDDEVEGDCFCGD